MISRRNYISITMLMVFVLFLCMSINYLKDGFNDYSVNRYTETAENYPSKTSIYMPNHSKTGDDPNPSVGNGEGTVVPRNLVVCIGDQKEMSMKAAAEWTAYTKRDIAEYPTLAGYGAAGKTGEPAEVLVIDPACVDWAAEGTFHILDRCLENGTSLVFCGLPDVSVIQNSRSLQELLGIRSVQAEETSVTGFYLREGFLLGGATFYLDRAETGAMESLPGNGAFPGERTIPWYLPAVGAKVYMKGVPEDTEMKADEWPIVMWRNSRGSAYVFAVNGTFMEGQEGIGLLSAMSAEMNSYEIYPVVNAQSMVLASFPSMADENAEVMDRIYSRPSIKEVFQKLTWPGISTTLEKYGYKGTCMVTPQYDYLDSELPDEEVLEYYLKTFSEQSVEVGLSGAARPGTNLMEKLEQDHQFFQDAVDGYSFASFYAGDLPDEQIMEAMGADVLTSARTVVRAYDGARVGPVGFLSENVTSQSALGDGLEYTHRSDFRVRAMETALGYLNMSFDMARIAYPETVEEQWEKLSRTLSSTISTYGQQYQGFTRTTAAECDMRIRQFLAMDYSKSRTGDQVELHVQGVTGPVWFILRTHNETILGMDGGSWEALEKGAYLVEVTQENAVLTLGPADQRYFQ